MATLIFNSLAYFEKLRDAGVEEEQARVHAEAMNELVDNKLATKEDLLLVKEELKKDIAMLKQELIIKLGGMIMGSISLLYILLRFGH
jgi:predicted Holliday junction resolvase-like endonuclease